MYLINDLNGWLVQKHKNSINDKTNSGHLKIEK